MKRLLAALALCPGLAISLPAAAADLTIGGLFPTSGSNAEYGQIFSTGANLAVEQVNQEKLLSGKLSIVYEDSQALPMQGVIGMNKLVNVTKVPFVLSAFTGVSKAIAPLGTRSKTVMVNGGGVGPDLAELGDYFWNTIPLVNYEVRATIPYLAEKRKLKRYALVYVDDPLGQSVLKELGAALKQAGGELAGSFSVPVTAQQFSGIAARVRDLKPDAVYIASYGSQQGQIVKQLRDNGVSQQIVSYSAFSIPSTQALPEARGAIFPSQKVDWNKKDDLTQRMLAAYKKQHDGKMPSMYVVNYYNAVRTFAVLAAALEKAGKPVTGENLLAQRKATPTFDFVGATVSFEKDGTIKAPLQLFQIVDHGATPIADIAP
jgi:ABC-type branched-subunit amino acid transport system substrate-binding protein